MSGPPDAHAALRDKVLEIVTLPLMEPAPTMRKRGSFS